MMLVLLTDNNKRIMDCADLSLSVLAFFIGYVQLPAPAVSQAAL